MSTDFKVIGINDEGTEVRFGGDDLDKINRILNGENLSLDIIIDNEWSFNSGKLVIRDSSGENKISVVTSAEAADWIITIPTLGGNQTPVFEDLEQELTDKTLTSPVINDGELSGEFLLPDGINGITLKKPAVSGGERFIRFEVEDAPTDSLTIENITGNSGRFIPALVFTHSSSNSLVASFVARCDASMDTGTSPLYRIDGRQISTGLVNRPILDIASFGTVEYLFSRSQADFKDNEIINASIDGEDNTFTNIPDTTLSDNIAFLDEANVFTALQTIEYDADTLLGLYRPNSTLIEQIGIDFDANNASSQRKTYGRIFINIQDNTIDSENSHLYFQINENGTLKDRLLIHNNGNLFLGANLRATLSDSGLTAQRTFTFPDEAGELALAGSLGSLDDLTDVDTSTLAPANNDVLTWNSTDSEWVPAVAPGASGGEANTVTNVGAEVELAKAKSGVDIPLRTLDAGTNVTITQIADTVTITATDTNTVTDALTELTVDVDIDTPSNLQVLAYNSTTSKWENETFNAERTGTATGDGNGSSVEFIVAHGLGAAVPDSHFIQCYSHSIPFTWAIDATNFTVTFDTAPGSGTDNVKFVWRVVG